VVLQTSLYSIPLFIVLIQHISARRLEMNHNYARIPRVWSRKLLGLWLRQVDYASATFQPDLENSGIVHDMTPQDLDAITSLDSAVEVFLPIPYKSPTGPVVENNHEAVHVSDLALEINIPHSNTDVTNFHGGSPSEEPNDAAIAFLQGLLEVGRCLSYGFSSAAVPAYLPLDISLDDTECTL
jgi:hypothetical protein